MTIGNQQDRASFPRLNRRVTRGTPRYLFFFVTSVLLVNALVGERGLMATLTANRQYATLSESIAGLQLENEALRNEARRLRYEPSIIEEIARRELGLVRRGERVFIVSSASRN
ncbi:MAG: septum formation initiator family protein [Acidobacteriota bacterium]|nr:septum formation initiator family protein [Acidobacteriota bacterium]